MNMESLYSKKDVEFRSQGGTCRAWLYLPETQPGKKLPCIVMAHGLGGTKDSGLEPIAEFFANHNFAVLLFDYRHFGASDGLPRQLLHIGKQVEDYESAIQLLRAHPRINPNQICLWGTSFSSGHVLTVASKDHRIAAVAAQNPMVDGFAAALALARYAGFLKLAQLALWGLADQIKSLLGFQPVTIPIVAKPGTLAGLATPGAYEDYINLAGPSWVNQMTTRMALTLMLYRPVSRARFIKCPTLIQACKDDIVTPPQHAVNLVRNGPGTFSLREYEGMGHFDIYAGKNRLQACKDQLDFFTLAIS